MHFVGIQQEQRGMKYTVHLIIYTHSASFSATNSLPLTPPTSPQEKKTQTHLVSQSKTQTQTRDCPWHFPSAEICRVAKGSGNIATAVERKSL